MHSWKDPRGQVAFSWPKHARRFEVPYLLEVCWLLRAQAVQHTRRELDESVITLDLGQRSGLCAICRPIVKLVTLLYLDASSPTNLLNKLGADDTFSPKLCLTPMARQDL